MSMAETYKGRDWALELQKCVISVDSCCPAPDEVPGSAADDFDRERRGGKG